MIDWTLISIWNRLDMETLCTLTKCPYDITSTFSLLLVWSCWRNNRVTCDLKCHYTHVTPMWCHGQCKRVMRKSEAERLLPIGSQCTNFRIFRLNSITSFCQEIISNIVCKIEACCLGVTDLINRGSWVGTTAASVVEVEWHISVKPISEPMVSYCKLDHGEQIQLKLE